jgi:hypothetical protein
MQAAIANLLLRVWVLSTYNCQNLARLTNAKIMFELGVVSRARRQAGDVDNGTALVNHLKGGAKQDRVMLIYYAVAGGRLK